MIDAGATRRSVFRDTPQGVYRDPRNRRAVGSARIPVFVALGTDPLLALPPGFHLRLARSGEGALLHDVMLRCWTGTVAANSSAYRESAEAIEEQAAAGGAIIVFEGDAAVGAGRFYPVPGPAGDQRPWVEIKRVGVLKTHRKLGLGAPLVAALEDAARIRGYAGAQLGVRRDQPRLVAFWSALGYEHADDVTLHTVNPLTPPPTFMRKRF